MKKSILVKIIKDAVREVVREEVKAAINEELDIKKPSTTTEFSNVMSHAEDLFNPKETGKSSFAKNPVLNAALNETADSWKTMGNKTLKGSDAGGGRTGLAAIMGMQSPDQAFGGKPTAQQMIPNDRKHIEVPQEVEKALTRDYSDLMKVINKKGK